MILNALDTMIGFALVMLFLSLIITTLVQTAMAFVRLRGKNLLWGAGRVLREMGIDKAKARRLAERILKHPAVSIDGKNCASAISNEEFVRIFSKIAKEKIFADDPTITAVRDKGKEMSQWFNMVMDRTSERFRKYAHGITITIAFLFCFILHVDGLAILQKISTDDELRARLVASAEMAIEQGEEVLQSGSHDMAEVVLREVVEQLPETPEMEGVSALLGDIPGGITSKVAGKAWLGERLAGLEDRQRVLDQYDARFDEFARAQVEEGFDDLKELAGQLEATQLKLFAAPPFHFGRYRDLGHLGGVIVAWMLLSLGAPFWFNMLRNLSSLRPTLARYVEQKNGGQQGG